MIPASALTLTASIHQALLAHQFPGDGLEAAAILLCAKAPGPRLRLLARACILVPHDACARERDAVRWPGRYLEEAIDRAEADALSIILVHSHPGGLFAFSEVDDASDRETMACLHEAVAGPHGSAIITPDGAMRARSYGRDLVATDLAMVSCAGDDLRYWWSGAGAVALRPVAFTSAMSRELARLHAVIIGVSGTGSIMAEQAARLGFGKITLIDFDRVELRNLNRILNMTVADAEQGRFKVDAFAAAIAGHRGPDVAQALPLSIASRDAVLAAAQGDTLFSCVDTLDARQIADLIAAAFLLPLFDVGVVIPVRRAGDSFAIVDAVGRIDYVQPGGASLCDRGVYTPESLRAEYLRRVAPDAHAQELEAGYIKGAIEEAPSVITLNMRAASACMNEFIARAYPFRLEDNRLYARTLFSLAAADEEHLSEDSFTPRDNPLLARGACEPLLGLPALSAPMSAEEGI